MTRQLPEPAGRRIAYFITPHGYGHAARASAVMASIMEIDPTVRFEVFTQVPSWFFQDSLPAPFGYHPLLTDIGLVQKTPLVEDLPETLRRLDGFLPFDASQVSDIAAHVNQLECRMVVSDIAPMGIAVARQAGIPSVLVENFTWDYIYAGYLGRLPALSRHIAYLSEWFDAADYHLQTEPVCRPGPVDLTASPISRKIRTTPRIIRRQLGIPDHSKAVLITLGGIPWDYDFLEQLPDQDGVYFIIPGPDRLTGVPENLRRATSRVLLLPHHSSYFHPDLVNASDAVIGKAGYSTLAEVYYAGIPFGYVGRPDFRETQTLVAFIEREMHGLPIAERQFQSGEWQPNLAALLALPRTQRSGRHGADQVASFVCDILAGID